MSGSGIVSICSSGWPTNSRLLGHLVSFVLSKVKVHVLYKLDAPVGVFNCILIGDLDGE